ncbi:MAG: ABC transporter [Bacteroidia bacterium]|nr:MAG: ABC transporter [Bacteroidia bacterium]
MQLFAIIAKQDEGIEAKEIIYVEQFLKQQLNPEAVKEYMALFHDFLSGKKERKRKRDKEGDKEKDSKKVAVIDSVRTLSICRKINRTLNQGQKIVTLVRLFELVNADRKFTAQRMAIINTVAEVFNISKEEYKSIESFVIKNTPSELDDAHILIINNKENICENCKQIESEEIDGNIYILQIKSSELYFLKYTGNQTVYLNGLGVNNRRIYLFASGSSLKLPKGKPIYYSDVVAHFMADQTKTKISFNVNNISFRFKTGNLGLRNISLSENHGKLIGIMGASGAGKTTLLNVLSGMEKPSSGNVLINGIDMHHEADKLEGVIGYIPQDDLLIEELTVFQNLYFSAKQCFRDKTEEEIVALVHKTLKNLGLFERKDLKVGSPLNKMISGGQRKRLNIALELIREPSILFVDEPTSGLSSRDSENVMDLLSELTLKGKLIFVVIHQPSSDIYKMFDKMVILDTGGYMIYYGNPVEGVMYFKKLDNQINSDEGECPYCGNITPELIFNIIEAQVVDEFGQYTDQRKVQPNQWEERFVKNIPAEKYKDEKEDPPRTLKIPGWLQQFKIYSLRDLFSKIANTQYVTLTLIESPLLAFILSFIIHYIADPHSSEYIFFENENIPPYIFMSIVVALFLGLTVSAEEIFRDRKILKREAFLNLSRSSYLMSKVMILFSISALQALLFVLIGNSILVLKGMWFEYWYVLFATFAFANMLGLNISASFNSAVTIYILIPLLMIPQMALGGAMFSFDKLNRVIGSVDKVPIIAEIMASRWAYEALIVHQFKDNEFEKTFFELEKRESNADFKIVHFLPDLKDRVDAFSKTLNINEIPEVGFDGNIEKVEKVDFNNLEPEEQEAIRIDVALLKRELAKEHLNILKLGNTLLGKINVEEFNGDVGDELLTFFKIARESIYGKNFEKEEELGMDEIPADLLQQLGYSEDTTDTQDDENIENEEDNITNEETENDEEGEVHVLEVVELNMPEEKISLKELETLVKAAANSLLGDPNEETKQNVEKDLLVIREALQNSFIMMTRYNELIQRGLSRKINDFTYSFIAQLKGYLAKIEKYHSKIFSIANTKRQKTINYINEHQPRLYNAKKNAFHNEATSDYVRKVYEKHKILRYEDQLIQQVDPIYLDPINYGYFDFRAHFYAPRKYFMGRYFDTFHFNIIMIWIMTLILYITLYYDALSKLLLFFGNIKPPAFFARIKLKIPKKQKKLDKTDDKKGKRKSKK